MITCPYCKEEFEKDYYDKNHVPCPMDRGDNWVWEEAPRKSRPMVDEAELERLRQAVVKSTKNFADLVRRFDEGEDILLAEIEEAVILMRFARTRYRIKEQGFRSVPLEQAVREHPHASIVWDPGARKES